MRAITAKAIAAFDAGVPFQLDNTEVRIADRPGEVCVELLLFDNAIARRWVPIITDDPPVLEISTGGWDTSTTRDRLNGIPGVSTGRRAGDLYLNGKQWDGKWTEVRA